MVAQQTAMDGTSLVGMSNRGATDSQARGSRISGDFADFEVGNIGATIDHSVAPPHDQALPPAPLRQLPSEQLRLPLTAAIGWGEIEVTKRPHAFSPWDARSAGTEALASRGTKGRASP